MSSSSLSSTVSSLAFMDDTNWIASSQQDLEDILQVAEEFYDFTRSALNKSKSKLLTTNVIATSSIDLKFGSSHINIQPELGSVRFLGVWINSRCTHLFVKNQLQQD